MENNKINFTKATILALTLPDKDKIAYYYDTQVSGLGIMLFGSGTKTFFLYKRVNGRPDKIKLGRFPDITIEQARRSAYAMINNISLGVDPKKEKAKQNDNTTLKEVFNEFLEKYSKPHKKTWEDDIYFFNRYIHPLASKSFKNINKTMIIELHSSISKNHGIYAANHSLKLLHTVFNKAIEWGYDGVNPCSGVKKFKEKSRERFLQTDEIPRFFESLNGEPSEIFRDFFYVALLTGARCLIYGLERY